MAAYQLNKAGVRRVADGCNIPSSLANADWQAYLAWVAAGNVPDPAKVDTVDTPAVSAQVEAMNNPALRGLIKALAARLGITPAQLIAEMKGQA